MKHTADDKTIHCPISLQSVEMRSHFQNVTISLDFKANLSEFWSSYM